MKIAVTGLRLKKLPREYGYDYKNAAWTSLKNKFKSILLQNHCTDAYTGMALGVDSGFALAVIELKEAGCDIKLHAVLPCANQEKTWPKESQIIYKTILSKADEIIGITEKGYAELKLSDDLGLEKKDNITDKRLKYVQEYKPYLMQKRNEYMVDQSHLIIAVWNGSIGGTKNCIEYAEKQKKQIYKITP